MIPFAPWSALQLLMLLGVPLLGLGLTLYLLGVAWRLQGWRRWQPGGTVPPKRQFAKRFFTPARCAVLGVAALCLVWTGWVAYTMARFQSDAELAAHYRASRRHFVLPQDFQYGELRIPRGSLIDRYDPFDNGEPQRPLGLAGLRAVRFAQPVQVAGVWATAMQVYPARLELAQDQAIRPVFHFDPQASAWVPDPQRSALPCPQGAQALFEVPLIEVDIVAEFGQPEPDGPQARFRPSQWAVTQCDNQGLIEVAPAYAGPAPKGARADVWAHAASPG